MRRHLRSKIRSGPAPRLHTRHCIKRHRALRGMGMLFGKTSAQRAQMFAKAHAQAAAFKAKKAKK